MGKCFEYIGEATYQYSDDWYRFVRAIMEIESGGRQSAVSPKGAYGCMQLTKVGAKDVWQNYKDYWLEEFWNFNEFWEAVKTDPAVNTEAGVQLLRLNFNRILRALLREKLPVNNYNLFYLTAISYNAGVGVVLNALRRVKGKDVAQEVLDDLGYEETHNYIKKLKEKFTPTGEV